MTAFLVYVLIYLLQTPPEVSLNAPASSIFPYEASLLERANTLRLDAPRSIFERSFCRFNLSICEPNGNLVSLLFLSIYFQSSYANTLRLGRPQKHH